jgi:hypothetical protein
MPRDHHRRFVWVYREFVLLLHLPQKLHFMNGCVKGGNWTQNVMIICVNAVREVKGGKPELQRLKQGDLRVLQELLTRGIPVGFKLGETSRLTPALQGT